MKQIRNSKESKIEYADRKGYTLVELIVTIAISVILLSFIIVSLSAYTRYAKFKKQNEYAQALYIAAQTQLTQYAADSSTDFLTLNCDKTNQLNNGASMMYNLTDDTGTQVTIDGIWRSVKATDAIGTLYYITGTKEDYKAYNDGTLQDERLIAMYDIFEAYLYDKSILQATVCIEFDPVEGLVYSVLYSEEAPGGFAYGNQTGKMNITDRTESTRKRLMLGYYGVDTLSKSISGEAQKPIIQRVLLYNGNTLYLTWNLSKYAEATGQLTYAVEVYDADTDNCIMVIRLNNLNIAYGNNMITVLGNRKKSCTIEAKVSRAATNGGDPEDIGIFTFPAWIDEENNVNLVLDAADLGAQEQRYVTLAKNAVENANTAVKDDAKMKCTFSMHRFLPEELGTKNIYCKVRGEATANYKQAASKTSNTENMYFATGEVNKSGCLECSITNARHLYNIRFAECSSSYTNIGADFSQIEYNIADDFGWNGVTGLVGEGAVYVDKNEGTWWIDNKYGASAQLQVVCVGSTYFPSISKLRAGSVFQTKTNKIHTIDGLFLSFQANNIVKILVGNEEYTGLFLKNYGKISRVTLKNVYVIGQNKTGSFCGVNYGLLDNLEVNSGSIYGCENVGGILGAQGAVQNANFIYDSLVNRADVVGHKYVGGIMGSVYPTEDDVFTITIQNSDNYGPVRGNWQTSTYDSTQIKNIFTLLYSGYGTAQPEYIGGIIGFSRNVEKSKGISSITISGCTSSPAYTSEELNRVLNGVQYGDETNVLTGLYVGGIIGYCDKSSIVDCKTLTGKDKATYVIGNKFVGGIAGYCTSETTIEFNFINGTNGANIIGREYVGGITGCIAEIDAKGNPIDNLNGSFITLKDWTNTGIVVGTVRYVGGITGYNSGRIDNCTSRVDYSETAQRILKAVGKNADYVGGVTGYNSGKIDGKTTKVNAVVQGKNYVGGIVGYQIDLEGSYVSGYETSGGYVFGRDFVGGYVGLNLNALLFKDKMIISVPNVVEGRYFVGGGFGGCFTVLDDDVSVRFRADNFLGSITGTAVVGGFAGILSAVSSVPDIASLSSFATAGGNSDEQAAVLSDILAKVNNVLSSKTTDHSINITSNGNSIRFGGVSGKIYTAGIAGMITEKSRIVISNVVNQTPVVSTSGIKAKELGDTDDLYYSYAGGITGNVPAETVIVNCFNSGTGEVVSSGSFQAGIAEVNRGRIIGCRTLSQGSGSTDNVAGIAGINLASGNAAYPVTVDGETYSSLGIFKCVVSGTMSGVNYIGGIAARNYGLIEDTSFDTSTKSMITCDGLYGGGIAGYNGQIMARKTSNTTECVSCVGEISFTADKGTQNIYLTINGSGDHVGAICGLSSDAYIKKSYDDYELTVISDSDISGERFVGGFVGELLGTNGGFKLNNLVCKANVNAENGYVGGIAAKSSVSFMNCYSYGNVEVKFKDNHGIALAGGITAQNSGYIEKCGVYGGVRSGNGNCGGITAENLTGGIIAGCEVSSSSKKINITGSIYVGGICALNKGKINGSCISSAVIENQNQSENGFMGGITGFNEGIIENCYTGAEFDKPENIVQATTFKGGNSVKITSYAVNVNVGGIAGINETGSIIKGNVTSYKTMHTSDCTIKFNETTISMYGNFGGITGTNRGTISYCSFSGYVYGTGNNPANCPTYDPNYLYEQEGAIIYGYGGIVGINGSSSLDANGKPSSGKIENCYVTDAEITGIGDPNSVVNVGGVAGVNGEAGEVKGIDFGSGSKHDAYITTSNYFNENDIYVSTYQTIKTDVLIATKEQTSYGHTGGVAGLNLGKISDVCLTDAAGTVADKRTSTTSSVSVLSNRGHVGGIVGYNKSSATVENVNTGKKWYVYSIESAQDNGCGGIIGYNASDNNITDCHNWATVLKHTGSSNGVGGMIGRCEIATSSTVNMINCINYGNLSGIDRVGGMIGVLKYRALVLRDCSNFGIIKGMDAGGIIGQIYGVTETLTERVFIYQCENHGTVGVNGSTTSVGGIIGGFGTSNTANVNLTISHCINTGLIRGARDTSSGIIGGIGKMTKESVVSYCINYGMAEKGVSNTEAGFVGASQQNGMTFRNCIGVSPMRYPISYENATNNFYMKVESSYYFGATVSGKGKNMTTVKVNNFWNGIYKNGSTTTTVIEKIPEDPMTFGELPNVAIDSGLAVKGKTDNSRYTFFKKVNPSIMEALSGDTAGVISNFTKKDIGEYYQFDWSSTSDCYKIIVSFRNTSGIETYSNTETVYSPTYSIKTAGHEKETVTITVTPSTLSGNDGTQSIHEYVIGDMLPTPEYHLELRKSGNTYNYKIILDNYADYEEFVKTHDTVTTDTITISIIIGNNVYQFKASEIECSKMWSTLNTGNYFYISQAIAGADGVDNSKKQTRESPTLVESQIKGKELANVTLTGNDAGFTGETQTGLSYRVRVKAIDTSFYIRSELVAVEKRLGVPVAVSSSILRVSTVTNAKIDNYLSGIPSDLFDSNKYSDIYVRSYPYMMTNNIVYMGKNVLLPDGKTSLTSAELKALYVTEDGIISDAQSGKLLIDSAAQTGYIDGLKTGYVIRRIGDDAYTLYYNILATSVDLSQIKEAASKVNMKNQLFYTYIGDGKLQPTPVIDLEIDNDNNKLTVTWDSVSTDTSYNYKIYGVVKISDDEEKPVEIESADITHQQSGVYDAKTKKYSIETSTGNWTYNIIRVFVTRNGNTSSGSTNLFACAGIVETDFKTRLSSVTMPYISLHIEDGLTQKNDLIYDIRWSALSAQSEIDSLSHYVVTIECKETLQKYIFSTQDRQYSESDTSTSIKSVNLNGLNGKTIRVSVKAIALASSEYFDSVDGDVREIELPSRLAPPELSSMFISEDGLKYISDRENIISVSAFENTGFDLTMQSPSTFNHGYNGKYELAIDVYDTKNGTLLTTVYPESDAVLMMGDMRSSVFTLRNSDLNGFTADFANQYIRVRSRVISDNQISSVWTDTEAAQNTYGVSPYTWVQLPRVRVDTADMQGSTEAVSVLQSKDGILMDDTAANHLVVNQNRLTFSTVKYSDSYRISIVHKEANGTSVTDWLTLVYNEIEKGFDAYWTTDNPSDAKYNGGDVFIATIGDGTTLDLPYKTMLVESTGAGIDTGYTAEITTAVRIVANDNAGFDISLILPDTESVMNDSGSHYDNINHHTSSVSVRSLAINENYVDSNLTCWYRYMSGSTELWTIMADIEVKESLNVSELFDAGIAEENGAYYNVMLDGMTENVLNASCVYATIVYCGESAVNNGVRLPVYKTDDGRFYLKLKRTLYGKDNEDVKLDGLISVCITQTSLGYGYSEWSKRAEFTVILPKIINGEVKEEIGIKS